MKVLVTGGAGYIGSHACVELLGAGHEVLVVDNLVNSSSQALERVKEITGKALDFVKADIGDKVAMRMVFAKHQVDAVMHFAGLKAVGESVNEPLRYYQNNISGSLCLFEVMAEHNVKTIIFSSSATVYGDPESVPINEGARLGATNPYGSCKLFVEYMLKDLYASDAGWRIGILRYFNPVGAHQSGLIGENPNGVPNNLMPFVAQVAVGKRSELNVFGVDYPTPDGTGVRDYIHVVDLVKGHLATLKELTQLSDGEVLTVNLGTGRGYSVLEMVKAFEKASGRKVPYRVQPRRSGDIAACWADSSYAKSRIGWQAEKGVAEMCQDAWNWQSKNPDGFEGAK